ncbi:hypothetical protein [Aeromicrobium sp. CTD01-1L150]|uniref:hypothetical protein n=1 Tax=Aeromicrobium sp. CTD01-1L150 TaxID=3341830 RepID=UPI0035BFD5B7
MGEIEPRHRRDAVRIATVVGVAVLALLPLKLVSREVLPLWIFLAYAAIAVLAALLALPSAVRLFLRNRPAETGERYWTLD